MLESSATQKLVEAAIPLQPVLEIIGGGLFTALGVVLWFVIRRLISTVDQAMTKLDDTVSQMTRFVGTVNTMREVTELRIARAMEDIASVRQKCETNEKEIQKLRDVRHDHDNVLTTIKLRMDQYMRTQKGRDA